MIQVIGYKHGKDPWFKRVVGQRQEREREREREKEGKCIKRNKNSEKSEQIEI